MDERFFIESIADNTACFSATETNHISKVRRKQVGDTIKGFVGDGFDYTLKLTEITKSSAKAEILSKQPNPAFNEPKIVVYLAMLKNDALSTAIDNLAELNVKEVKLFKADFSIANIDAKKLEKLNAISTQASKQCERADIMKVSLINKKDIEKDIFQFKNRFFAYENSNNQISHFNGEFALIIGPEGGFSPEEVKHFSAFCNQISLGKTIMRAEVACISAVSMLKVINLTNVENTANISKAVRQ